MKTIIYYFSATGNSLQVARDLSLLLDDSVIEPLPVSIEVESLPKNVGIVFPVHLWGVPEIVLHFIEQFGKCGPDKYFFAVATCKSQAGDAIGQLHKEMRDKGIKLSAGFCVPMPGNNIIYYNVEELQVQNNKLNACNINLTEIAEKISSKQVIVPKVSLSDRMFRTKLLHTILSKGFHKADQNYWVKSACNGCGICAKICPVNNIKLIGNRPYWQHHCEQCTACINLCPSKAIQYGKMTTGKQRYINPTVTLKDLIRK